MNEIESEFDGEIVALYKDGIGIKVSNGEIIITELQLEGKKINFMEAVMYRTVSNDFTADEKFDYDMLVFFSPSGISSLLKNFPNFEQNDIRIGCFGPATAKAVKEAGLRLDVEAPTPEAPSMTAALEQYLKKEIGEQE